MNVIQAEIFSFQSNAIRTFKDALNELWFVANDVCEILGYKNPWDAVAKHCKQNGLAKREVIDSMGRNQEVTVINEPNLYRLIIKSRKPEAEAFESWVMEEVLPSIRKTGTYTTTISAAQQQQIKSSVLALAKKKDVTFASIYRDFYAAFDIPRYQDLPSSRFDEAMQWLGGVKPKKDSLAQPANLPEGRWLIGIENGIQAYLINAEGKSLLDMRVIDQLSRDAEATSKITEQLMSRLRRTARGDISHSELAVPLIA